MTVLPTIKYGRTVDGVLCLTLTEHIELMREYRNAALEEAEAVCLGIAMKPSNVILGVAIECRDAIRALKEQK